MIFDFTPDPKVLIALTHTPMQPFDALCELIDNAIDSFQTAKIQGIICTSPTVFITLPSKKQYDLNSGSLIVQDNGPGMTSDVAEKAIRAGFSGNNPFDSLGLFGMGFNISTGKFGNRTTFMTCRADSKTYIKTTIDLQKINYEKKYSLDAQEIEKDDSEPFALGGHGTIIEVSDWWPDGNANHGFIAKLIRYGRQKVLEEIGRRYATILRKNQIKILVDGERCVAFEHCKWDDSRYVMHKGEKIPAVMYLDYVVGISKRCGSCTAVLSSTDKTCLSCGSTIVRTIEERVTGWIGIQRFDSDTEYGIDLIRNGRAIRIGEKSAFFEYEDEFKHVVKDYPIDQTNGRIIGEVNLDFVPVDFSKQDFQRSSAEWQKALEYIRGSSSLQPNKPGASENTSSLFRLYQGYRKLRNYGRQDMYMGYWDPDSRIARKISKDIEKEYYQKFLERIPGYYDDTEWWKLVESATEPPIEPLVDCPNCGAQNQKSAIICIACGEVLQSKGCINSDCNQKIALNADSCPFCGVNQIPVVSEPWTCLVCGKKNSPSENICKSCHMPKGAQNPISHEILLSNSDKADDLSIDSLFIPLSDGSNSEPLEVYIYFTRNTMLTPIHNQALPLIIFKRIGKLEIFIDKSHRVFSACNVSVEEMIASEVAMYLFDSKANLSNYPEHNLSNLKWEILRKYWFDSLAADAEKITADAIQIIDRIRSRIKEVLGANASYYYDEMTPDQMQAMTSAMISNNIDLTKLSSIKGSGEYLDFVPADFLLVLYDQEIDKFFNCGVWEVSLLDEDSPLLVKEVIERARQRIKLQYRNVLEDIINCVNNKYVDPVALRRVKTSIQFINQKMVG